MGLLNRVLSSLNFDGSRSSQHVFVQAHRFIEKGNSLEDAGDLASSLRCYDKAVAIAPELARAHINRGNALQSLGRLEEAVTAYKTALAFQPDHPGIYANLGNTYMRSAVLPDAICAYEQSLKLNPNDHSVLAALAAAQESANRLADAVRSYQCCIDLDAKNYAAQNGLVRVLRAMDRPAEALTSVERLIADNPDSANAHFLHGEILSDLGRFELAATSFARVLNLDPHYFLALTSMGDVQRKLCDDLAALNCYAQALKIAPEVALLHMKIANTSLALGRKPEAMASMNRALELDPQSEVIQFNAGNLYDEMEEYPTAATHFERAIELCPDAQAYNNLGNTQRKLGKQHASVASFEMALAIDPQCAEAHSNLGIAHRSTGAYAKALASFQTACRLRPQSALFQCNMATAHLDLNDLKEAYKSCERALELDPRMVEALNNMGTVQLELGAHKSAAKFFKDALAIDPSFNRARHNLSHAQLAMGEFAQAWVNYEYRIEEHQNSREWSPLPQWTGQRTNEDDRILIFVEQGLGDMLQFVRYLPLVASRFPGGVSLYAIAPLVSLFRRSFPMVDVLDQVPSDQAQWQWQCPLLSLPLAFCTVLETIPSQVPYLVSDLARSAKWAERIQHLAKATCGTKKIGLVWKPGAGMKIAHLKATSLQTLDPLFSIPGCTWFSLQKEPDPDKEPYVSSGKLIDWSADFQDFDDTAALAVNMDLVISVDTSVAHLAGGLGLPTWLLNRYASDWRWMREREDSPWYPTVKIFAQDTPGNWEGVARRVAQALAQWLGVGNPIDWRSMGNSALQLGDLVEAQRCYEKGVGANPRDAACHANLGYVLMQQGQDRQAHSALIQAVALDPCDADALYLLGSQSRNEGDLNQAITYFQRALKVKPNFDYCRRDLCLVLVQTGQLSEARTAMQDCVESAPESADALAFQATMHLAFGEYAKAEAAFLAASRLAPLDEHDLVNLGAAQLGQRNAAAAVATYQKVLDTSPNNVTALHNQANAQQLIGNVDLALDLFRMALANDPDNVHVHQNLLSALTLSASSSPTDYLEESCLFGERVARKTTPFTTWPCQKRPLKGRKLRVGFVSGDLRQHPVGYFLLAVLRCLDTSVISCIAYSNAVEEDTMSQELKELFSEWFPVFRLSDKELAEKIHADGIDVLVDLAGHTAHNRLPMFTWRPAPVQVAWLGYWASTGLQEMDYILVDEISVHPNEVRNFTEQPWLLPSTRLCFTPPQSNAQLSLPPMATNGFITFGSFQKLDKISNATLSIWAAVLNEMPTARFRLQSRPLEFSDIAVHLLQRMTSAGMDASRVDLIGGVPREQYLQAYNSIDIVLDTFPFPGGTTTAEAVWMGVPTVTLSGNTLVSRQGESMLKCVGLDDWVAHTADEYIRIAVENAVDLDRLAHLRKNLRQIALVSPLFNARRFAENLTAALISMARQQETGNLFGINA